MILTDYEILSQMRNGSIQITPFNRDKLGSNSYDVTLSKTLLVYTKKILDVKKDNPYKYTDIPSYGMLLLPGELYLGSTIEYTSTTGSLVPQLEGKSSLARLGIMVHLTAGFGDIGFKGHWTLEITVVKPVRIYAEIPIAQIYYMQSIGYIGLPYSKKKDAKYHDQGALPVSSQMWKNFEDQIPPYPTLDKNVEYIDPRKFRD